MAKETQKKTFEGNSDLVAPPADTPEPKRFAASDVFVSTVFKSGTVLLRHIIQDLTGLHPLNPPATPDPDYGSADAIWFEEGTFYNWHSVPTEPVKAKLRAVHSKPIFLVRNIFDLLIAQYHHLADDVDAAIGRSTNLHGYFQKLTFNEGIATIICGAKSRRINWQGYGFYLNQIQEMLRFSTEYPCCVLSYDRLVTDKAAQIDRLVQFLEVDLKPEQLDRLLASSSFDSMKATRSPQGGSVKHFRKGTPGDHVNVLADFHYDMVSHVLSTYAPDLVDLAHGLGFNEVVSGRAEPED